VLFNICLTIFLLLLLELLFGNWLHPNRMNRLNLLRNIQITYENNLYPPTDQRIVYRRDEYGFRGTYSSPAKIDVLTMGGSTTDQRYITEGKTWQDVIAKDFSRAGKTVTIVNAGVDGQTTYGLIKDFDWWFPNIPNLKVKYYLLYIGINDFFFSDMTTYDDLVRNENSPSLGTLISENSAIFRLMQMLRGTQVQGVDGVIQHRRVDFQAIKWTKIPNAKDYPALMKEHLAAYRGRLRLLVEKIGQAHAIPICVTQTMRSFKVISDEVWGIDKLAPYDNTQINGVDEYYMMQLLNQATIDTCKSMGGKVIDLAGEMQENWIDSDFYDFYHNTPQGAEKLGHFLYNKIKEPF
jgi:hypothetical protein